VGIRLLFSGTVPKVLDFPDDNEDSVAVAPTQLRLAVSDGASDSFDSQTWSRTLANSFVYSERAALDAEWITSALAVYRGFLNRVLQHNDSWAVHSAAERGSFASLLGVEQLPDNHGLRLYAVGDTSAVLLGRNEDGILYRIDSFPYTASAEFRQRPVLISTNTAHNGFAMQSSFPETSQRSWPQGREQELRFVCMTDALAEWAFRCEEQGHDVWGRLFLIRDEAEFCRLVVDAREQGEMRCDDSTLVVAEALFAYGFGEY